MNANPSPVFKDAVGQEYGVGDWIAYPVRHGSSMHISHGQIIGVRYKKGWRDQVQASLSVEGIRKKDTYGVKYGTGRSGARAGTHYRSTVFALDRVVKIPPPPET